MWWKTILSIMTHSHYLNIKTSSKMSEVSFRLTSTPPLYWCSCNSNSDFTWFKIICRKCSERLLQQYKYRYNNDVRLVKMVKNTPLFSTTGCWPLRVGFMTCRWFVQGVLQHLLTHSHWDGFQLPWQNRQGRWLQGLSSSSKFTLH